MADAAISERNSFISAYMGTTATDDVVVVVVLEMFCVVAAAAATLSISESAH